MKFVIFAPFSGAISSVRKLSHFRKKRARDRKLDKIGILASFGKVVTKLKEPNTE